MTPRPGRRRHPLHSMSSIDRARGVVDELNQTVVVDSIRTVIVDRRLISRSEH